MSSLFPHDFPFSIPEPSGYYQGVDAADRVICRNVIVFERLSRSTLQQKHLSNRMHHRYVLMRVLHTGGVVSIDGKSFQIKEGDSLLVAPHQFHHYIDLDADELRWVFITFELQQGEARLDELTYRVLEPKSESSSLWAELISTWVHADGPALEVVLPILDRLLTHLVQGEAASHSKARAIARSHSNEWIAEIEALIIQSVKAGWTFEEVAARAGLSERHLRNRFEQQMGISLRDYRSNYQFHRAISLMRDSKRSLSEVAELSGFNSQSVFTRFIRRMANRTPRELRTQILDGHFKE
jgi:AraC-like DNA-binding protein